MPLKVVVCAKGNIEQRTEVIRNAIRVFGGRECEVEFLWIKCDKVRDDFVDLFPDLKRFKVVDKRYLGPLNSIGRERRKKERNNLRKKFGIVLTNRELCLMSSENLPLFLGGVNSVWVE